MDKYPIKRPTIAFFISDLEGAYPDMLCRIAIEMSRQHNFNLVICPGKSLQSSYSFEYQFNVCYEYITKDNVDAIVMCTGTIGKEISKEELSEFCFKYKPLKIVSVNEQIEDIPSITLDNYTGFKKGINHIIKEHGKRKIAFIRGPEQNSEAQLRYSVYLEALLENDIPFDEKLVYLGNYTAGSGISAIKTFLDERKVSFDALIASNDNMALSAMRELKARNIRVPEDVSVMGYDNTDESRQSSPSLTTVCQPYDGLIKNAFIMALQQIKGEDVINMHLACKLFIRESCGCSRILKQNYRQDAISALSFSQYNTEYIIDTLTNSLNDTAFNLSTVKQFFFEFIECCHNNKLNSFNIDSLYKLFKSALCLDKLTGNDLEQMRVAISRLHEKTLQLPYYNENFKTYENFFATLHVIITDAVMKSNYNRWSVLHDDILHLKQTLNTMVIDMNDTETMLDSIVPSLASLGINRCFIYLYNHEVIHRKDYNWHNPRKLSLALAFDKDRSIKVNRSEKWVSWENIFHNELIPDKQCVLLISPLFFMEEQLGFIICDFDKDDKYLFESLMVEISCAIKLSYLIRSQQLTAQKLQNTKQNLEEHNKKLNILSYTDELTMLYNRRGFMTLSEQSLYLARSMGKSGLLFFADIDNLKKINDNYGHSEGDCAIKSMADILRKTFRSSDIIARLGGDEFTIFTTDTYPELIATFGDRLNKYTDEYNFNSNKPYNLSISFGCVPFSYKDNVSVENLMSHADNLLYEHKKRKKSGVDYD